MKDDLVFTSASLIKYVAFVDIFQILLKVIRLRQTQCLFHSWSARKFSCFLYKVNLVMKLELFHCVLSFDALGANVSHFAIVLYDGYVCGRLRY